MMKVNQKDIVLIKFPFSDGTQSKLRPALVISNKEVNETQDIIAVQITSKFIDDNFSVLIPNNSTAITLPFKSWIRTHKIFCLDKKLIQSKISTMHQDYFEMIIAKIESNLH
jgi:mRNA interferase MazF